MGHQLNPAYRELLAGLPRRPTGTAREPDWKRVLRHYGPCACCGEGAPEFLVALAADGRRYVRKRDLVRDDFPPGAVTVLCFNCRTAKSRYGYCPHKGGK